jgi:hypothetical protein
LGELVTWTSLPEAKYFSGTAVYRAEFVWDRPPPRRARLLFSQIREAAEIRVNGAVAGAVWNPPMELELGPWLRPGTNTLEVTVANLPLNRFLGSPDEDLGPLRAVYGDRFPAPEEKRLVKEPAPSGLIGPVRLRVEW